MKIIPVPCLEDNYAYLYESPCVLCLLYSFSVSFVVIDFLIAICVSPSRIVDEGTKKAAAVDPVEPEKVLKAASDVGANVDCVLTTHHHWDHAGGNEKMRLQVPGIKVFGGSLDNVKGCTDQVENGTKLSLGKDIEILCLHTPWYAINYALVDNLVFWSMSFSFFDSHTKGHISYYVTSKEGGDPAVFTGDTLVSTRTCLTSIALFIFISYVFYNKRIQFIAGCGRFFEGTAEQMYQSLVVTLGSLPKSTRVYCGHEYTVKNLKFMLTLEPENEKMKQKLEWAEKQCEANQPTVPSTIGDEFEINTFMRVDLPEMQAKFGASSPVEALREVRKIKDNWKG
ncbi:hypothetical protein HU200_017844 [Digitaria exilis]|uniref:hydroxyacylglutathione hydrolase n=1 Tax=Digitaria exilis TaxID=1010633 RepID=A0A835KI15_9POAL|nr:hypothetical protein HU200_017844 [Digitaria exilis]